jgi:hypothetical protein
LPNSETNSIIAISLQGTDSTTNEITLSQNGFKAGLEKKVINAEDVGNLQSIRLMNKSREQYQCNKIRIESQAGFWDFECNTPIKCPKCTAELTVANMVTYDIIVKTSSVEDSGTSMPIYISLLGSSGASPKKLLSENGFETGSVKTNQIETRNIENIYGINLYLIGYDSWRPEEIILRKQIGAGGNYEEKVFRNIKLLELNSPDKALTLKLPKQEGDLDESNIEKGSSNSLLDSKESN